MDKNTKMAIAGVLALAIIGGGIWFMIKAQKDGTNCPYCVEPVKHSELLGHTTYCPKNTNDRRLKSGSDGK